MLQICFISIHRNSLGLPFAGVNGSAAGFDDLPAPGLKTSRRLGGGKWCDMICLLHENDLVNWFF